MKDAKTSRGRIKRAMLCVAGGVALFCGLLVWAAWPYVTADAPGPDPAALARLNALLEEGQPEGENGWDVMRDFLRETRGESALGEDLNEAWTLLKDPYVDPSELFNNDWDDPRLAEHRKALQTFVTLLPPVETAMAYPRYFVPYRSDGAVFSGTPDTLGDGISIPTTLYTPLRKLTIISAVAMRRAANEGRWNDVARLFETGMALAERLSRQALLIEWLIGMSMESVTLQELRRLINEFDIPEPASRRMLQALARHGHPWRNSDRLIKGEVEYGKAWSRAAYSDDGVFLWWRAEQIFRWATLSDPTLVDRLGNLRSMVAPSRARMEEIWEQQEGAAGRTFRNERTEEDRALSGLSPFPSEDMNEVMLLTMEQYGTAGQLARRQTAEEAATAVMLRLELYHASEGRWPTGLSEAMNEIDFRDPVTGVPFAYERVAEERRPYVLRSPSGAEYLDGREDELNPIRRHAETLAEYEQENDGPEEDGGEE